MTARVVRDIMLVSLGAVAVGLMVAGIVIAWAGGTDVRAWYGLTPENPAIVPAWWLWVHNMRTLLPLFGAALAVAWWPRARWFTDPFVALFIGWNVSLVAVAFAAYGGPLWRVAPAHYPLELLALATPAAAYLDARRERMVRPWVLGGCALAAAVLLAGVAVTEGTV